MISEFNTNNASSSTPGKSGMDLILKIAIGVVAVYFGYKYLIKEPAEKDIKK
jgi:hypothetical protein